MFRWFSAQKRSTQVQPSRPVIEGLEGRRLMSATLLDADAGGAVEAASSAGGGHGAGKVSMQDFHFLTRSGGTGKVSMQDFHFVMRTIAKGDLETASHGTGAGAGKVSMQDFHFVMKNNSTSPR